MIIQLRNCYLVHNCWKSYKNIVLSDDNTLDDNTLNLVNIDWEFANFHKGSTWNLFESRKTMKRNIFWTYFCSLYIEYIGMWIANKSVQFFWKLIWDNMNILRVKSIMNRDPSARMCNRIRVPRGQQIKLVHTVSKSNFGVIYVLNNEKLC